MDALITVNGTAFPDPVQYDPSVEPIGNWDRNAKGYLVGDLVGYKAKLTLAWEFLTGVQFKMLINAVAPFFVTVKYWDAAEDGYSIKQFYASARSGKLALRRPDGSTVWKGCAFNLIER